MASDLLKVPKTQRKVTLWVHPEGQVIGHMFLNKYSSEHAGEQQPLETLNQTEAFVVLRREQPDEVRFYNRASIVRVEFDDDTNAHPEAKPYDCRLQLMDGSLITGTVCQPLPPDRARLYDYLNRTDDRFIKLALDGTTACLVNKSYIIHATDLGDA